MHIASLGIVIIIVIYALIDAARAKQGGVMTDDESLPGTGPPEPEPLIGELLILLMFR